MRSGILLVVLMFVFSTVWGQSLTDSPHLSQRADSVSATNKPGWISVQTKPEGAEVYEGTSFIGKTPIDRVPCVQGEHVLTVFYPSARAWNPVSRMDTIAVPASEAKSLAVDFGVTSEYGILKQQVQSSENNPDLFLEGAKDENSHLWMGYVSGATMVLSGALSAYLKTHADKDFNQYVATRDPNLLDSTRRLDKWAGVSLIVSEISFGFLTYLLVSQ
jgi:hypothetical protein